MPAARGFFQKPGWNSCMPVQLKINECIVIIVNIVVIVKVRRKFVSAAFFISPPTRPS